MARALMSASLLRDGTSQFLSALSDTTRVCALLRIVYTCHFSPNLDRLRGAMRFGRRGDLRGRSDAEDAEGVVDAFEGVAGEAKTFLLTHTLAHAVVFR